MNHPQRHHNPYADTALDVRGVTKVFRKRRLTRHRRLHAAVDHVSFGAAPGEIYGVIGANGSGKSTLIRILSTLLFPDAGEVRDLRARRRPRPQSVRPLLNRVSADPSFFRAMSAMENLLFFGRAYGLSGREVRAAAPRSSSSAPRRGPRPPAHAAPVTRPTTEGGRGSGLSEHARG